MVLPVVNPPSNWAGWLQVASHVVECALLHSSPDARQMLKDAMASNAEELRA